MTKSKYIAGAGGGGGGKGGGGGGHTPTEADDSLQSKQFANVLDLISEGEIQGLDDGNKSIFFDGTPLQAPDGTYNFSDYTVSTRNGTQAQTYIPGVFSNVESETQVGVEVTKAAPVVRQITDDDVNRVRVTIEIPSLRRIEDDGDIVGASVSISIQVRYSGGSFTTVKTDKIKGKSNGRYQRDYLLTLSGAFPVDIKVVRNSADNSSSTLSNTTNWSSFTSIIDAKLAYPNSALIGLRLGSKQFNRVPQRKYLIRGIKIGVPTNAKIDTSATERLVVATGSTESITDGIPGRITYTGVWNGELSTDPGASGGAVWTNDPAWCLWDLLTNDRYGVGIPESSLDRYDFFAISQYCNTLVDDGNGGQEPRFSCNLLINQRKEVYNVIQEMTSIFRGISYYGAGSLVLLQDKPADAQYTLGPANVVDGAFSYSGSSVRSRHTCATVAYQDYDELGEVSFEYVEDADAVAKYGVNNKDIKAVGCYSQGQANRLGKWTLLSEQDLYETCNFAIGIDSGIVVRPGMVVDIADPLRGGTRRNGRVSSATTTEITIDSDTDLSVDTSENPKLSIILPNGLVETRNIGSISGKVVTVPVGFSQAPAANAPWLIQTDDIESQQFRVVSVAEEGDGVFGVAAIKYNESIYNAVEQDLNLTQRDISNLTEPPGAVSNLSATEFLYEEGGTVRTGVDLSWTNPVTNNVNDFAVRYRLGNSNFETITTEAPSTQIKGLKAGNLEVQVSARNFNGKSGPITKEFFELAGKTAIPGNVQNLTLEPLNYNSARLRWDETVDLDVKVSGKVHIRHSNLTDGSATWSNSTDLIAAIAGSATEATVPLLEGEYLVKFEDDGLRKSATETTVVVDQPVSQTFFGVKTQREDQITPTPFTGSKTDTTYDSTYDALILDSDGISAGTGEYAFADTLDLEAVYSLDLERRLVARGIYPTDLWDSRTDNIDTWQDIDGGVVDQVNAELYVRKTNDNPSSSPTYSAWQPLANGVLKARAFQFKAVLTSSDPAQNILVDELGYKAQFQQRTEQSTATIASGTSAKAVTFTNAFFTGTSSLGGADSALPTVGITPLNMATGDFFELSSISKTGFTVTFKNSSGTIVDRNFNYMATGFGKAG
jgi:predicted phage tail protein